MPIVPPRRILCFFPREPSAVSSQWYYKRDGQRFGPLTSRKIRRMAWRGDLLPTDLLWKEGMTGWRPAGDSHRLFRGTDADPAARPR
ncbi:MAG: DUF4339 domain-containing protein, partial [Planctomycetia bacterium]|nr:DUF4339 domain-containing protein [Planctomycetia bacterium]